jgi:hypothetical protein
MAISSREPIFAKAAASAWIPSVCRRLRPRIKRRRPYGRPDATPAWYASVSPAATIYSHEATTLHGERQAPKSTSQHADCKRLHKKRGRYTIANGQNACKCIVSRPAHSPPHPRAPRQCCSASEPPAHAPRPAGGGWHLHRARLEHCRLWVIPRVYHCAYLKSRTTRLYTGINFEKRAREGWISVSLRVVNISSK